MTPTAVFGVVQKGPFVRGARVTVQELDARLAPNGRTFEVETTDDLGAFRVPVNLTSRFVEVIGTGYYYNEFRDQLSIGPLTLRSVSDVTDDGLIDVNLLTSISAPLIRHLVAQGQTFASARTQAESAVLDALGLARQGSTSFDKLDIATSGNENAVLLAGSLILEKYAQSLGDSEVAQLTQLLSQIGAAISNGGNSTIALAKLNAARCSTVGAIDAAVVRANLTSHYASFGITVTIPPFESFIGDSSSCVDAGIDALDGSVPVDASVDATPANEDGGDGTGPTNDASDEAEPCAAGSQRCAGTVVQTCAPSGQWIDSDICPFACQNAVCVGSCSPGTIEPTCNVDTAVGSTMLRVCDDSGQFVWRSCSAINNAPYCYQGMCANYACPPGMLRCGPANDVEECRPIGLLRPWNPIEHCANPCLNGACLACFPGSTQCEGSDQMVCDDSGNYVLQQHCPNGCNAGACL